MDATRTRILFVCSGNICRSPLAEAVFRDVAREAGTPGAWCGRHAGVWRLTPGKGLPVA